MRLKLSIIIPIYKVEQYVEQCLASILNVDTQGLPFEVICVNDGTPDKSMTIVEEFQRNHENLYCINQENQGQSVARNEGLKISNGDYIWFFDSDDWMTQDAILRALDLIENYPDVSVFATPVAWKHPSGDTIDWNFGKDHIVSGIDYLKLGCYTNPPQRFIIKRSFLDLYCLRFYPGIFHEDELFGTEMLYLAEKVYLHNHYWCNYRQHGESVMHTMTVRNAYNIITVHQQLIKFMDIYVREEDKEWFQRKYFTYLEVAVGNVWHLRNTPEFKQFLSDTKAYRYAVCDSCTKLGGWRWKIKCWLFKHPVLNKYRRELFS